MGFKDSGGLWTYLSCVSCDPLEAEVVFKVAELA